MRTFVINLDKAVERWSFYRDQDGIERWSATSFEEIKVSDPTIPKMISYHNLSMREHLCKLGAFKSHYNLWRYIAQSKLNNVLILEDDAEKVNELPDESILPTDGITYFGGYTSHVHVTKGPKKCDSFVNGVNKLPTDYRMLMLMAYYIPTWQVAEKLVNNVERHDRWRAIDCMMYDFTGFTTNVYYPACFIERPVESQIRKNKKKFSNEFYEVVKG